MIKLPKLLLLFLILLAATMGQGQNAGTSKSPANNEELIQMVKKDQQMRMEDQNDLESTDKKHRQRVFEMLAAGLIKTNRDKLHAALILQHTALAYCDNQLKSNSVENYLMAYYLAKSAYDGGEKNAANFVAVTYDRYLLYTAGYQKYGTQRIFDDNSGEEMWAPIDSLTTDEERMKYGVPSKEKLLLQFKMKQF